MRFHGEIQYDGVDDAGNDIGGVHSDICYRCGADDDKPMTDEFREFLHACLDEWLNNSRGTGAFWVGDPEYFKSWETE